MGVAERMVANYNHYLDFLHKNQHALAHRKDKEAIRNLEGFAKLIDLAIGEADVRDSGIRSYRADNFDFQSYLNHHDVVKSLILNPSSASFFEDGVQQLLHGVDVSELAAFLPDEVVSLFAQKDFSALARVGRLVDGFLTAKTYQEQRLPRDIGSKIDALVGLQDTLLCFEATARVRPSVQPCYDAMITKIVDAERGVIKHFIASELPDERIESYVDAALACVQMDAHNQAKASGQFGRDVADDALKNILDAHDKELDTLMAGLQPLMATHVINKAQSSPPISPRS